MIFGWLLLDGVKIVKLIQVEYKVREEDKVLTG